jgi:N-alpha-acetyl-L-2,4-diaminobutyrate deacetylase
MIAHYVYTQILPLADAVVDIHSGGKTLNFVPLAAVHEIPDKKLMTRGMEAMLAFGAPVGLVLLELDNEGMFDTAVEEMGKVFVTTELGGGGTATAETVSIAETGVRNLLCHFGLVDETPATREARGLAPTRLMRMPDARCYVIADETGIYEVLADLGAEVEAGQPIGQMHSIEKPQQAPAVYRAERAGSLIGRRHSGLAKSGDCLGVIAIDYDPAR